MNYQFLATPIGMLRLISDGSYLLRVEFPDRYSSDLSLIHAQDPVLSETKNQLSEYFSGTRSLFQLPLNAMGTEFQQTVWRALANIPLGEVRSYSDIASEIGRPTAVRAVGAANGRNPLPVIVPCHRVIGRDGSLTGFAGGLATKKTLLRHEGVL